MSDRVRGVLWIAWIGASVGLLYAGKTIEAGIALLVLGLTYAIVEGRNSAT